jgi:hypothetical protein
VRGFKQDGHKDCPEVEVYSCIQPLQNVCPHDVLTGSSDSSLQRLQTFFVVDESNVLFWSFASDVEVSE